MKQLYEVSMVISKPPVRQMKARIHGLAYIDVTYFLAKWRLLEDDGDFNMSFAIIIHEDEMLYVHPGCYKRFCETFGLPFDTKARMVAAETTPTFELNLEDLWVRIMWAKKLVAFYSRTEPGSVKLEIQRHSLWLLQEGHRRMGVVAIKVGSTA